MENNLLFYLLQIIKAYTLDDCENPIQPIFIVKLEAKLNERNSNVSVMEKGEFFFVILCVMFTQTSNNNTFTMDENRVMPLRVGYKYDEIKLEEIDLPTILNLDEMLVKI